MEKYVDYYKILGVSENADEKEIKRQYRMLAKKYHPDMQKGVSEEVKKEREKLFKQVNNANEILGNPTKRKEYDDKRNKYLRKQEEKRNQQEAEKKKREEEEEEKLRREQANKHNIKNERPVYYDVWNTYKEVLKEESKDSIKARFERRKKIIPKAKTKIKVLNGFVEGFINVLGEIGYQTYKLKREENESKTRYILRNRYNFLSATAILLMLLFGDNKEIPKEDEKIIDVIDEETSQELIDKIIEEANTNVLYNYHTVVEGDTLSELAQRGHISMTTLQEVNNIDRETIYIGEELIIPYHITNDLLKYYTEIIPTNNKSLEEIAIEYNTDIESLKTLNKEGITEDNLILTDEILVPKFLTEMEYIDLKYNVLNNNEYVKHD